MDEEIREWVEWHIFTVSYNLTLIIVLSLILHIINSIDGMDMAVYDEKSDYDNPFVEPLFDLNIYKAKVRPLNDDLSVKTKAMKFVIRCDQVSGFMSLW